VSLRTYPKVSVGLAGAVITALSLVGSAAASARGVHPH
jgi:hypothetical protein